MFDGATFTLKLVDKVSGPGRKVTRTTKQIEFGLKRIPRRAGATTRALKGTTKATRGAGRAAKQAHGSFADFFKAGLATSAVGGAIGAITALGAAVLGTAAHLVTFGQNNRFAFDQLAKHGTTGIELFAHARALAVKFGLDVEKTAHSYANFLKLQFDPKQAETMVKMGADLRALGASAEEVEGIFLALGQIKGKGRLQAQEMLQLAERGVSTELVQEEIGKALGGKTRQQVQKLQEAGKVSAEVGLAAIESAIKRKLSESELGDAGARFAETTFEGISGRAKALATDTGLDLVSRIEKPLTRMAAGGLARLEQFLDTPRGAATLDALADGFSNLVHFGEALAGAFGGGFMDTVRPLYDGLKPVVALFAGGDGASFADTLKSGAKYAGQLAAAGLVLVGVVGGLAVAFVTGANAAREVLFGALGGLADAWVSAAGGLVFAVVDTWENIKAIVSSSGLTIWEKTKGIGKAVVMGFVDGIKAWASYPIDAIKGLFGGAIDAGKKVLGIKSPSRVTRGIGGDTGEGLALGIESKARRVAAATEGLALASVPKPVWTSWDSPGAAAAAGASSMSVYGAAARTASAAGAAVGSGGGTIVYGGDVNVSVDGSDKGSRALADLIGETVDRKIDARFRRLALEL